MKAAIERYASRGWRMHPLVPGSKRPMWPAWQKEATADPRVLLDALAREPNMNLGLATGQASGFFVVDIDPDKGGKQTFLRVQQSRERFPSTLGAHTRSGGYHLYYRADEFFSPRNRKLDRVDLPGIETRGEGGFVVAAPSYYDATRDRDNTDGVSGAYRWANGAPIAHAPRWLIERIESFDRPPPIVTRSQMARRASYRGQGESRPFARLEGAARTLAAKAPETGRNMYLNNAAYGMGFLVDKGQLDENFVRRKLYDAARASGLDDRGTKATIESGLTGARRGKKG